MRVTWLLLSGLLVAGCASLASAEFSETYVSCLFGQQMYFKQGAPVAIPLWQPKECCGSIVISLMCPGSGMGECPYEPVPCDASLPDVTEQP